MRYRKEFNKICFFIFAAAMLFCTSCGKSDNTATTMYLVKTAGDVGVEDGDGKSVALTERLGLYSGYGLGTQSDSFAWIDLDETKLAKMDEKSKVAIVRDGRKLELTVASGSLFFNVTEPLKDDESMDIRTSTMTCGIRGTCGWVTADENRSSLALLDGTVECVIVVDGVEETVTVNAKEVLTVVEDDDNVAYEVAPLVFNDIPEFIIQEEVADEPFVQELAADGIQDDARDDVHAEDDTAANTEDGINAGAEDGTDAETEDGGETPADEEASESSERNEAIPGEEISFFDASGLYTLENNGNADEVALDFGAYTDGAGGPFRIYSGQSTTLFDGEWTLGDDEYSFRDGVAYSATDGNGNTLSFVLDANAAGITITASNDSFNTIEGHYTLQERYETP